MNNKFNVGDIIIPIKGQRENTWVVVNVMHPAEISNSFYAIIPKPSSSYALQNLEDGYKFEFLYCSDIDEFYEKVT